ncbi:FIG00554450: hypothetical protein [Cronobacter condimenti 1330]|uniref:Uncharacterized protein n=1 Tax=Cronobacter condimenti 1330 TaxID=1073999 RepID=K8A956_9ENTR|nr:hypothetical protein [Cronobacter condimenti]CCJ72299.1 FIG00554450: hypothetical protein [Cronobacter condimenti 1330]
MNSGYFIWLKNTFRWGYRLSIKQLFRFIFYSALAYCLLTGVLLVAFQIIARTPLINYLTVDDVMTTVTWGGRTIQALVGIPVALNAIKTFIWLFTTAPHGLTAIPATTPTPPITPERTTDRMIQPSRHRTLLITVAKGIAAIPTVVQAGILTAVAAINA